MRVLITARAWPGVDGAFAGPVRLCEGVRVGVGVSLSLRWHSK